MKVFYQVFLFGFCIALEIKRKLFIQSRVRSQRAKILEVDRLLGVRLDINYGVTTRVCQYSYDMSAHHPSRVGRPGPVQAVKIVAPPRTVPGGTVDMVTLTTLFNAQRRSIKRRHWMADIEECTFEPPKRGRLALTL